MRWPDEIEDDLLTYRNLDIGLWHRLTINPDTGGPYLSSRRLLVIIDRLPEQGEYKKAKRAGRQTRAERVAEETYNELARLRSSYHVVNGGKDSAYEPFILLDPVDERIRAEDEAAEAEAAKGAQQRFDSALGYS